MTQERQDPTVIHGGGGDGSVAWVPRCGELNVKTTTTDLVTMTCPKCINVARERMRDEIKYHRDALALLAEHLAQLDHGGWPLAIVGALFDLDIELDRLRVQLKLDAITQEVGEEASDD